MAVKEKIKALLEQLNTGIYEKEEIMALALLSSIAGESIFLLGPPGVAKSLIARRLKYAYKDAKVFEYLMSRFSTPDEIFGPVSIKGLKEDKYERMVAEYIPAASVVFLDEIWKAGPSIQNALLTIINEKIFRNGGEEIKVPMKALISASNELPNFKDAEEQGQSLEALWDRFLVRLVVNGIEDGGKFNEMIAMPSVPFEGKIAEAIADDEYYNWSKEIDQIIVPENVFNVIDVIRKRIQEHNDRNEETPENQIYVSDRRWRKIVRLLRTSAFLNDRTEVDLMDCFLIKHCIWSENEEEQMQKVSGFVNDAIRQYGPSVDMDLKTERNQFSKLTAEIEKNTSKEFGVKPILQKNGKTNYYLLTKYLGNQYCLLESAVVDALTGNSSSQTTIFSKDLSKSTNCYIAKAAENNNVILRENNYNDWQTYQLHTEPVIKPYQKSPSRGDFELWNTETDRLLAVLGGKKTEVEKYWNTFSESFYNNLFVDKDNADRHIKSEIDDVKKSIDKFMIEVNKIRNNYQRIYKTND